MLTKSVGESIPQSNYLRISYVQSAQQHCEICNAIDFRNRKVTPSGLPHRNAISFCRATVARYLVQWRFIPAPHKALAEWYRLVARYP